MHPEPAWDEYAWERFLQQQDRKTDRYLELLEQHMDDPERDQIIAREMGWPELIECEEFEWEPCDNECEEEESPEGFELHPLYQSCFALTVWIDQIFDELGEAQHTPAAVKLATNAAIASAKLAAALSDDEAGELGMTIAYLKRALKAITNALDASRLFAGEAQLSTRRRRQLHARLFHVRDGIIEMMGLSRREWRRRYD